MSIWCEINLFEHPHNAYKPGGTVQGKMRYILNEETQFKAITVSFKGFGYLRIRWHEGAGKNRRTRNYYRKESYVDIDNVILPNTKEVSFPPGMHEIPFAFTIPANIPPTFKYYNRIRKFKVHCEISYYIRIKFGRPGLFNLDKRFKTNINMATSFIPTLPMTPVTYGLEKKPFKLFQEKEKLISIKFTIDNSVLTPAGRVKINYEIDNSTKLLLKGIKMKLTEELTFKRNAYMDITDYTKFAVCTAPAIEAGGSQSSGFIMDIPLGVSTLLNSQLVSRDYFVNVKAELPFPHRNAVLKIPIQILETQLQIHNFSENTQGIVYYEPPPPYSEVMSEYKKDDHGEGF